MLKAFVLLSIIVQGVALTATVKANERVVKWKIETCKIESITPEFRRWFQTDDQVPVAVIAANDAISSVRKIDDELYEAVVSVGTFPLVKLIPRIIFDCRRDQSDGAIILSVKDQEMDVSGPEWAKKIVLAASKFMESSSSSRVTLTKDDQVVCESIVETSFQLPRWVPIPVKLVQENGRNSIQKQVDSDIQAMISNLVTNGPSGNLVINSDRREKEDDMEEV